MLLLDMDSFNSSSTYVSVHVNLESKIELKRQTKMTRADPSQHGSTADHPL